MKKILLLLFVTCSLNVFSQVDAKSKTVLKDFVLGYDSEKSLIKKGIDINEVNTTEFKEDEVTIVRLDQYFYGKDVSLVFVNHTLFSVRYYVYTEGQYERYKNKLYKSYNVLHYEGEYSWFNKYISIEYNLGADNEPESFVHYDSNLLKKYPQYKDY
jgi:hypothetical protein